ncbi:MAG: lipoyl synthase [Piscirickettsiaceae bacterium]|nr:lipoyl synthase [Piscirickettsiaceae bacterium]
MGEIVIEKQERNIKALKGKSKVSRIPIKFPASAPKRKPRWIRATPHSNLEVIRLKKLLRRNALHTVCEEAACPNLGECFTNGTATFMIMGNICTRRCPFCDVAHGKPSLLDENEPQHLAKTVATMNLKHVVITSVDRDDLRDGGAMHFGLCINEIRKQSPETKIEILVPDFRGRMEKALNVLATNPPDIFNHNLESIPRLYKAVRPGSDYQWSLNLLERFQEIHPDIPTKSGLMLGLGESLEEVMEVMLELRNHNCKMLTLGQYLQPSCHHLAVERFVTPLEFDYLSKIGKKMGFKPIASGPMVRSSYHADLQAQGMYVS